MWAVQLLLGTEFCSFLHSTAVSSGETQHGPQYQNQHLNCVHAWNVRILCFGALPGSPETRDILDGAWKSTCSFFSPTFLHSLAPCSGCGQLSTAFSPLNKDLQASGWVTYKVLDVLSPQSPSEPTQSWASLCREPFDSCGPHKDFCLQE